MLARTYNLCQMIANTRHNCITTSECTDRIDVAVIRPGAALVEAPLDERSVKHTNAGRLERRSAPVLLAEHMGYGGFVAIQLLTSILLGVLLPTLGAHLAPKVRPHL